MKLNQLRKIIREEVRSAVKEELQDMLNEAVKYASTPTNKATNVYQAVEKGQPKRWSVGKSASLDEMLQATKAEMSQQDYRDISGTSGVQKPNFASMMNSQMVKENQGTQPGLDISNLDFVKKAKAIYDKSVEKNKI